MPETAEWWPALIVVPGPASQTLGVRIAHELGMSAAKVEYRSFPDGESYIRIGDSVRNDMAVIVQSCYPPQDKRLMELLLMLDAARDLGAKKVWAVVPYVAYARQDDRFREGEALSAKTIAKLIENAGADFFLTFDVPSRKALKFFTIEALSLSAMPEIARHLKSYYLKQPYILAPDKGAAPLAQSLADALQADHTYFEKTRDRVSGEVKTESKTLGIAGRDAIIVDDVISTGGTIANVGRIAKSQGAARIFACCTHALLVGDAERRLKDAGIGEIIGTDCVESKASVVSVARPAAEALRKMS